MTAGASNVVVYDSKKRTLVNVVQRSNACVSWHHKTRTIDVLSDSPLCSGPRESSRSMERIKKKKTRSIGSHPHSRTVRSLTRTSDPRQTPPGSCSPHSLRAAPGRVSPPREGEGHPPESRTGAGAASARDALQALWRRRKARCERSHQRSPRRHPPARGCRGGSCLCVHPLRCLLRSDALSRRLCKEAAGTGVGWGRSPRWIRFDDRAAEPPRGIDFREGRRRRWVCCRGREYSAVSFRRAQRDEVDEAQEHTKDSLDNAISDRMSFA